MTGMIADRSRWTWTLPREVIPRAALLWCWALVSLTELGCRGVRKGDFVLGKAYVPENFHRQAPRLPENCRRVAVLPLTCNISQSEAATASEVLEPIVLEEIGKTKRFEVLPVPPEKLRQWTGRLSWAAEDTLPAVFFDTLRRELACDAVLFVRVTQFQAYPPLAIGWRFKLVDCKNSEAIWSIDEVFDAANTSVVNAARIYQQRLEPPISHLAASDGILVSPRRFARYSADAVLSTLPAR